jgi:integrase/recombinase XerD
MMNIEEKQILLNDFETYLRAEGQRLNTLRGNSGLVSLFLDWLAQEQINYLEVRYTDLMAYVNYHKERGNAKNTINGKIQGIKHFYNFLNSDFFPFGGTKEGYNPAEELRIKGIIRRQPHDLLEWEELEQLYNNYPTNSITGKRNKAILGMLIYQGLHNGEVAKIELRDVKLEEAKVYVPSVSRSNSRILKLESVQILQLQKYITQVRPVLLALRNDYSNEKLFISTGGSERLDNSLNRLMKVLKKLNSTLKNPYQIRASVITCWLKKHNIRQVQYMTGHRYISSTEHYRTDNLETLQEQIDLLHPLK